MDDSYMASKYGFGKFKAEEVQCTRSVG
jgi:hypothetical protein